VRIIIGDFAPDLDSVVAGIMGAKIPAAVQSVLTDTNWVFAVPSGWQNMPTPVPQGSALPSQAYGAYSTLVGTEPFVVLATANQLYIYQSGSLVSQGLTLTSTTNLWYFTTYGDDVLVTNGVNPPLVSTNAGSFAPLGGSPPVFSILEATDFALFGIVPVSEQYYFTLNDTQWTPNIATQTGTSFLTATAGPITAAKALRSGINIYKRNSFYNLQFTGPPFFFQATKVSDEIGTAGPYSVIKTDTLHYFWGPDDFYATDGFSVWRVQNNLRRWFLANLNTAYDFMIYGVYDLPRSQLVWWFSSVNAPTPGAYDSYVSLSLLTGKWSHGQPGAPGTGATIDLPLTGLIGNNQPWTWGFFENTYGTWGGIPPINWGSILFDGGTVNGTGLIDSNHQVALLNGPWSATLPAYITTGDVGDKRNVYRFNRARPNFTSFPTNPPLASAVKVSVFGTYNQGQPLQEQVALVPISNYGYCDFVTSNRLQRLKVGWYADCSIADLDVDINVQGSQ
jgi:hypothetical protein